MRIKADKRCRIQSRELFKPSTSYHALRTRDGRIVLTEVARAEVSQARLVRRNGHTYLESRQSLTQADVDEVLSRFP